MGFTVEVRKKVNGFTLDSSWEIRNELAVLFGYSGAGKSLTLQLIAGLMKPDSGSIRVEGVELTQLPEKAKPVRREGERGGRWVLLDYVDIVVHVQHTEEREFYSLDRLWKDCPQIEFVDRDLPAPA